MPRQARRCWLCARGRLCPPLKRNVRRPQFMSGVSNKIWALVGLSLCAPPSLLALALMGRSSLLLMVGFLATMVTLLINSLLLVSVLVLWSMGVERVTLSKPMMLISLLGAGVVTDVVILWLMPPLAK
jgi:hypothetical protein